MNKRIFKSIPVAFALLALASCSNEDFLGNSKDTLSGKKQLIATVEDPTTSDNAMRAAFSWNADAKNTNTMWQKGDEFRVYDELLHRYDSFVCDGSVIALDGTAKVQGEYTKALFPGESVSYAGWDSETDTETALMTIESEIDCGAVEVQNGKVAYVAPLPLWGDATIGEDGNLQVGLKHLAAYAEVTLYEGTTGVKALRVVAASSKTATTLNQDEPTAEDLDAKTPLAGRFNAELKTGGVLKVSKHEPAESYSSILKVDVPNNNGKIEGELHVFIPIIPNTYKYLVIQKYDGSTWTTLTDKAGAYENAKIARNTHIANGLVLGDAPIPANVYSIADLNKLLEEQADKLTGDAVINVSITDETYMEEIANGVLTSEGEENGQFINNELKIPTSAGSFTLNLKGAISAVLANHDFKISGGGSGPVTLNIEGGVSGTQRIKIETACELVLAGEWNTDHKDGIELTSTATGNLTLGKGNVAPFNTTSPITISATNATVTVDAGTGKVASITPADDSSNNTVVVNSGEVESIGAEDQEIGNIVTVSGGKVGTLVAADNAVTVSGGAVADLTTAAGNVTVTTGAEVTKITTASGTVAITEAVVNSVEKTAAGSITLTGGNGANAKLAEIKTLKVKKDAAVTVTSTDKTAIVTLDTAGGASNSVTFNSSMTAGKEAKDMKVSASDIANGQIYTAAQLASIGTGNYTLNATTLTVNAKWTPVNLSGNFTLSKNATISGLNAPLFGTVSGTSVVGEAGHVVSGAVQYYTLTISSTNISDCEVADQGALAGVVEGTATIQNVTVTSATITAKSGKTAAKNYGALVGRATGKLALKNISVQGTVTAQANIGGYVGNFAGTEFSATVEKSTGYAQAMALGTTNTNVAKEFGTVGYFIGSITTNGTAKVSINRFEVDEDQFVGDRFSHYFTDNWSTISGSLKLEENKENNVPFTGMQPNHEIGYSTATAVDLNLYGAFNDWNVLDIKHLDYINKFGN